MPFIGNQPALSYTSFAKQDFTTSATTSYTLDNPVANANELALFINFVRQEPTTAYSASGTSLTLTSATSATDDMYCVYLGKAVQTVNPPAGSVGTSQLADASVTPAKLNLNDNLLFNTSSKGIYLGVTSATASNLLDDYEEGTWTPTFTSGGNTLTISGGTQTYRYTKIGRQVFIEFNIENSTVSGTAATGDQRITLPFTGTSGAVRNPSSLISFYTSGGLRFTGADVLYGEIGTSSTFIQLQEWVTTSGYRNISIAPTTGSGTYFWFNITYTTDA
jgi:hypothetical protein